MNRHDEPDYKLIPYGLLNYFSSKLTRQEALAQLLKSHENEPKLFPRVDYRDVEFWYNSFEKRNFNLHQTPKYDTLSKLENLPVLENILHRVGTEDQKSLRRVSGRIKELIDSENRLYDKVELRLTSNSMKFEVICGRTKKTTETIYKRLETGCEITRKKDKTNSEMSMFDAAFDDFKKTVEKIHTKVKQLTIKSNQNRVDEADRVQFLTGVTAVMASLKEPLHVEEFNVTVKSTEELNTLLSFVKPGVLLQFNLVVHDDERFVANGVFKLSEVSNFKSHCESLKYLLIGISAVDMKLDDFVHIPRVYIEVASATNEEIVNHKNKILALEHFEKHTIHVHEVTPEMREGWQVALAPFDPIEEEFGEDENVVHGSWPIPGNDEKILAVEFDYYLKFLKKSVKKVQY